MKLFMNRRKIIHIIGTELEGLNLKGTAHLQLFYSTNLEQDDKIDKS